MDQPYHMESSLVFNVFNVVLFNFSFRLKANKISYGIKTMRCLVDEEAKRFTLVAIQKGSVFSTPYLYHNLLFGSNPSRGR
jgi:hypothetical protein